MRIPAIGNVFRFRDATRGVRNNPVTIFRSSFSTNDILRCNAVCNETPNFRLIISLRNWLHYSNKSNHFIRIYNNEELNFSMWRIVRLVRINYYIKKSRNSLLWSKLYLFNNTLYMTIKQLYILYTWNKSCNKKNITAWKCSKSTSAH